MKKVVALAVGLVFFAGMAFAQVADGISVEGWGRAAFAPLIIETGYKDAENNDVDGEVYAGTGVTWGSDIDAEISISGSTDYVGFGVGLAATGKEFDYHDLGANIWAKPFGNDYLKVTAGRFVDDTLRGKIGSINNGFEYFSLRSSYGSSVGGWDFEEDAIFSRFNTGMGFMLSSSPIPGLFIGVRLDADGLWFGGEDGYSEDDDEVVWNTETPPRAEDVYRGMQFGIGYEIENIGHVRLQWIGGYLGSGKEGDTAYYSLPDWIYDEDGEILIDEDFLSGYADYDLARIEAAFALTAVENLTLDIGAKIWLPYEEEKVQTVSKGVSIGLGAQFDAGAFGIGARVDTAFGASVETDKDNKKEEGLELVVRLAPSYKFDFATIVLDAGLGLKSESQGTGVYKDVSGKDSLFALGFGLSARKDFSNGHIQAGVAYSFPLSIDSETKYSPGYFSIPVVLQYSF